ncbi:MFS transporter [Sphingobium sp.]|uniref:MFS transporter n=1 Tax=Sphingobium sp. TaxID=1912891 RepID=UPI00260AF9C9|nr:MFS transporter [Sphingobium sp.]
MQNRPWHVVLLLATLYVISYIDRLILTLLVEPMKADLGITDIQVGMLIGPAFAILFSVIGLPVAWLIDRGNRVRLLTAGIILWSLSTLLAGYATSFTLLFLLRMGLAMGESVLAPAAISLIGDLFPHDRRAAPSAVFIAAGTTGVMLAYVVGAAALDLAQSGAFAALPLIGALPAWRQTLVLIGLPGLIMAPILLLWVREPTREKMEAPSPAASVATVEPASRFGIFLTRSDAIRFYAAFFIGNAILGMMLYGALAWYPTHLVRSQNVSPSQAGYIFSTALALGVALTILFPTLSQRLARSGRPDMLMRIPLIVIPVGLLLFVAALLQKHLLLASLLMAIGFSLLSAINALPSITVPLTAPLAWRGRLVALVQFCNNIISLSLGAYLIALAAQTFFPGPTGLGQAMLVMAIAAGPVAWLLYACAWRPYHRATTA